MAGVNVLVIEHERDAGIGFLQPQFLAHGIELDTVGPAREQPVPASLEGYAGLVVLGGSMGPTDDEAAPWLPATRALLVESVQREVPTLAVCLGAQLLTTAMGGLVGEAQGGPEIGLSELDVLEAAAGDPLFGVLRGSRVPAVQWHWLEATNLPPGATLLASNAACTHQAFRVGPAAWGVQFHPEVLTQTVSNWYAEDAEAVERLGYTRVGLVDAVRAAEPRLEQLWGGLADRFAGVVMRAAE